jgi:hypothetical protein
VKEVLEFLYYGGPITYPIIAVFLGVSAAASIQICRPRCNLMPWIVGGIVVILLLGGGGLLLGARRAMYCGANPDSCGWFGMNGGLLQAIHSPLIAIACAVVDTCLATLAFVRTLHQHQK